MMVMSKPKKASSFLRPAQETNDFSHRPPGDPWAGQPTIFVQEEEEERVDDGDEDAAPQRDPVGKQMLSR